MRGLYESLGANETRYDVVSGVSIGSINAVAYSLYPKGEEEEATEWMCKYQISLSLFLHTSQISLFLV